MHNPSRIAHRILTIHTATVLVQPLHDCTPTALHATSQCSATEHRYQYNRSTIAHCHNKNTRSLRDCTCTKFKGACQYRLLNKCWLQAPFPKLLAQRGPPCDPLGSQGHNVSKSEKTVVTSHSLLNLLCLRVPRPMAQVASFAVHTIFAAFRLLGILASCAAAVRVTSRSDRKNKFKRRLWTLTLRCCTMYAQHTELRHGGRRWSH